MKRERKNIARWLAVAMPMMLAGGALAQQAQQAPRPAPVPAQHAAPPTQPAPQPAPSPAPGDVPQSTTATYGDWIVQCQTRAGPPPEEICDMAQVAQVQGKGTPFSRVAVARPEKGQPVRLIVQVPVNASFRSNVRIQTGDNDPGVAAPFANCMPTGCFAEFDLKEDALKKLRLATGAGKFSFADASGRDISVPISFNGFSQAFDALAKK
jgi:invasion protein IalB